MFSGLNKLQPESNPLITVNKKLLCGLLASGWAGQWQPCHVLSTCGKFPLINKKHGWSLPLTSDDQGRYQITGAFWLTGSGDTWPRGCLQQYLAEGGPALAVPQALEGSEANNTLWAGHSRERQCRPFARDAGGFAHPLSWICQYK